MPAFVIVLLKRVAISLIFDYLFEQILKFLAEKVKESENTYDDDLLIWFGGYRQEIKEAAKAALGQKK